MEDNEKALLTLVAAIIIVLGIAGNVLTPEGVAANPEFQNVFYGVLAGAVIGLLGYMQKTELPSWETAKFFITLILSGIAGYVAYYYNMSFQEAFTWLGVIGFDVVVERIVKMGIRRLSGQAEL